MEQTPIVEEKFIHSNKPCIVIFTSMGHRCGYVAVEKNSPLNNIDYMDLYLKHNIDIDVHGGITFSGKLNKDISKEPFYWFGFDCAHLQDGKDFEAIKKYFGQKELDLAKESLFYSSFDQPKSLQYCINECKTLAEQLTEAEKEMKEKKQEIKQLPEPTKPTTKIYIVTAQTGNTTYLIEAYQNESNAIAHVNNAIKWYNQWTAQPAQALATSYTIWDENQNPYDNITPDIIDDSIIYDYQTVKGNLI